MRGSELKALTDSGWDRHQEIIRRFEIAWKRGERPKIDPFLPDDDPRRQHLLVELVHADLEFRIKAGELARVEEYLRRYPDLAESKQTLLDLIQTEFSMRRRKEPDLRIEQYRSRFPDLHREFALRNRDEATGEESPTPRPTEADREVPGESTVLPRRFGKFELRERLGLGAFGIAFRAWDTVLTREVVVKVPRTGRGISASDLRVFLRDARLSVHLRHPNIVEILDAGLVDGIHITVRAFVEGKTLADQHREAPLTVRESAELVAIVANAVDYAHVRGIIHRDLKPSNILLDREGKPYVMDFGLSKNESGDSTLSPAGLPGLMIGTPAYMAPEQARGETYLVDARSDVYALGVILYEMTTGSLPFRGRGRMLLFQIEQGATLPPRSLNDEIPVYLESICLKALSRVPDDRYPSARAMSDDLRRFLDGTPIALDSPARDSPPSEVRTGRADRIAILGGFVLLTLVIGVLIALWLRSEGRRERDAQGVERLTRGLLELAAPAEPAAAALMRNPSDRAWVLTRAIEPGLDGDPALIELAADARLSLARRAMTEGSDAAAWPLWDRAIAACEASLQHAPGRTSRLEDLAEGLASRAKINERGRRPVPARADLDRSIRIRREALDDRRRQDMPEPTGDRQLALVESLFRFTEVQRLVGEPAHVGDVETIAWELTKASSSLASGTRRRLAGLLLELSAWHIVAEFPVRALEWASRARQVASKDSDSGSMLALACLATARAERLRGREVYSAGLALEAVGRFEALLNGGSGRLEDRQGLIEARLEAARQLEAASRWPEAIALVRAAMSVQFDLDREFPDSHATRAGIGEARIILARASDGECSTFASLTNRLRALNDLARALELAPGEAAYGKMVRDLIGETARSLGRPRAWGIRAFDWSGSRAVN